MIPPSLASLASLPTLASLPRRAVAATLGGVLAAAVLAGCSDDSKKSSSEPETPASSATDATDASSTGGSASYLPVPVGVTLTDAGTALQLGDEATVAWEPRQDRVVALDLTVDRIDQTSYEESFEGWVVTKQMKEQTPYFVRVEATNVSDADAGGLLVPLYAMTDATSMYEPLSFQQKTFEPCPGGMLPDHLVPQKTADLCFVYLLPEGSQVTSVAFDVAGDLDPITWTGPTTSIEKPKKDKKDNKDKKDKNGEQAG